MPGLLGARRDARAKAPAGAPVSGPALAQGLLACWPLTEAGGTLAYDASGQQAPGTVSGATWTAGPQGTALHFATAGDVLTVASGPLLFGAAAGTVAAWVRLEASDSTDRGIYSEEAGGSRFQLRKDAGGTFDFYIHNGTFTWQNIAGPTVSVNTWYHVVATFVAASSTLALYINGTLYASGGSWDGTFAPVTITASQIGQETSTSNQWIGQVAQVALWARALTAPEVQLLYAQPAALFLLPKRAWLGALRPQGLTYLASTASPPSWTGAQTVLQLQAPAYGTVELLRLRLSLEDQQLNVPLGVQLYTAAGAVSWSNPSTVTPVPTRPWGSSGCTVAAWGTGTVTDGAGQTIVLEQGFNAANGYTYLPVPDEVLRVAAGGYLGVKLLGSPLSARYDVTLVWREVE